MMTHSNSITTSRGEIDYAHERCQGKPRPVSIIHVSTFAGEEGVKDMLVTFAGRDANNALSMAMSAETARQVACEILDALWKSGQIAGYSVEKKAN